MMKVAARATWRFPVSFLSLRSVAMHLLAVGLAYSCSGCKDRANSTKPPAPNSVPLTILQFENAWSCQHSEQGRYVVRKKSDWDEIWRKSQTRSYPGDKPPPQPPPPVDFDKNMILAAFRGSRGSTGYSVKIAQVTETDDRISAIVEYHNPGPGEVEAAVITYPFTMVSMRRSDKPVDFRIVVATGSP